MRRPSTRPALGVVLAVLCAGAIGALHAGLDAAYGAPWPAAVDATAAIVASVLCARASMRAGNTRARVAWLCQSAACALWALFPLIWWLSLDAEWGRLADSGRLGFLAFASIGLVLTARESTRRALLRLVLDGAVGAAAVLIVVRALLLPTVVPATTPSAATLVPPLCFPLGALVLMIFYGFLALSEFPPGRRRMPLLFVTGLGGIQVADLAFAISTGVVSHPAAISYSAGWAVGFTMLSAAALVYRGTTRRELSPPTVWWQSFAPYLALPPAAATVAWQAAVHHSVPATELVAGGVIIAVVLVRQLIIVAENRCLVMRLTASERRLQHQASHDPLTGLGNRSLLLGRIDEVLADDGRPLSLLFCDLDDFKQVNDTLGHHTGDELLIQVGRRLRAALRAQGTAVRLGGDEFAAVLECTPERARDSAHRLWESFQEPFLVLGSPVHVSASIGLATVTASAGTDADALLREADDAMYAAKRSGKNGVQVITAGGRGTPYRGETRPAGRRLPVGVAGDGQPPA